MATIKKPAKKYADGGSVTTSTKTTKKPESTVMKPLAKEDRYSSLGGEIGKPPFGGKKPKPGTKVFNGVTGKYDITRKNGGAVKKAQVGMPMSSSRVKSSQQKINDNVLKIQMRDAAKSIQQSAAGNAKNGKSMKKCKYGCK